MEHDTEDRLSKALRDVVRGRPYALDMDMIEKRGRKMKNRRIAWGATAGTGFAAAIAAVAVAVTNTGGAQAPAANLAAPESAAASEATADAAPLVHLVSYLQTAPAPTGDATLVVRDQVGANGSKIDVYDLFADNGDLYFSPTRGGLPAQVAGKHANEVKGDAQAVKGAKADKTGRNKAVAAAKAAATGDLNAAREQMFRAYEPTNDPKFKPQPMDAPGATPTLDAAAQRKLQLTGGQASDVGNFTDSWVYHNSIDALEAGAGDPGVRAGVLRLLGQMPEVKVAEASLDGKQVLNLTVGQLATGNGEETLTINADNGLPIKFVAAAAKGGVTNYAVTRVKLADVANGQL